MIVLGILAAFLLAALVVGILVRRNEGRVRSTAVPANPPAAESNRSALLTAAGVIEGRPTVLHFSADWCGPCAAVRRVVANVVAELADTERAPLDLEVDIDANPELARALNVLSLPTTFVLDSRGLERFRISGVPKAADLRTSLGPLTVSGSAE
ncbi:thioredoxin family protein [Nocardia sp. CDC153]|uniref:thioredoxin family protein n=1 Tax=Nocardia sp. CDC153 TaxID=3112167 RepID=UPI002DBE1598|nr:thioredoxin family protein [Nocardia sp. CDC153]MEC3955289.1 thioredoxin family protein [Nocardia sp. CDC153]